MYKVTLPIEMNGYRYGIEFKRSVGHTDDERIAGLCRAKGFDVELMADPDDKPPPTVKSPEEMTVVELKAFAAEKGIDLAGKTKKEDILAAVLEDMGKTSVDTPA